MATTTLIKHCGARDVTLNELATIEAPPATETWFPISHFDVYQSVSATIRGAGYEIGKQAFSLTPDNHRFFGTMDLTSRITEGISLAVGFRNSTNKTFPIGLCMGQRVFVCDNLAFTSEIVVNKKHTRFGQERYREGIANAVASLGQYQASQARWIDRLRGWELPRQEADSLILRAYEEELISSRMLPEVLKHWRNPEHDEFRVSNGWALWNAFTSALGEHQRTQPAKAALTTIKLQRLFSTEVIDGEFERIDETEGERERTAGEVRPDLQS